jgi:hypothetical protein
MKVLSSLIVLPSCDFLKKEQRGAPRSFSFVCALSLSTVHTISFLLCSRDMVENNSLQQALLLGGNASSMMKNPHDATLFMAIRKFVCTSYRIHSALERKVDERSRDINAVQFLQLLQQSSRNFREQLGNLLLDIELIASNVEDNPISFQHEYDLTAYIVAIWHLCEIFYLEVDENVSAQRNTSVGNNTSMNMITWLKMNGSSPPLDFDSLVEKFRNIPHPQLYTSSLNNNHRMEDDAMIDDENDFVLGNLPLTY